MNYREERVLRLQVVCDPFPVTGDVGVNSRNTGGAADREASRHQTELQEKREGKKVLRRPKGVLMEG